MNKILKALKLMKITKNISEEKYNNLVETYKSLPNFKNKDHFFMLYVKFNAYN